MAMSKREKTIAAVAWLVLGALALDHFVVSPFYEHMDALEMEQQALEAKLSEARLTIASSLAARKRWADYRAGSLQTDASSSENNLLNALRNWSQDSRLTLTSIRPDRTSGNHGLQEKNFHATAQGQLQAVSQFVYRVETTTLPIRIREMQIASRSEGVDDLSIQLRLSTIWADTTSPSNVSSSPVASR